MMMFMVADFPDQTGQNISCGASKQNKYPPGWLPHEKPYTVWEPPLSAMLSCWANGSFTMDTCSFDQLGGAIWEQRYKQELLANGVRELAEPLPPADGIGPPTSVVRMRLRNCRR